MDMTGIYAKDINRTIDGVIKADESAHIRSEVDEYVMTSEIRAGLERILDEWKAPRPQSNGVWISGFFGSGKSHMLKMMSYLLGDVRGSGEMTRQQVAEVFTQKARGHEMLIAGIGRSQQIPALSMLFNIDAKDDKATSRPEAMIEVFYRAFFEARGLYTADLGVGALERDLVDRGLFDQFKECFRAVAGGEWEERRAGTVFAEAPTARALAGVGIEVDKPIASYRASLNRSAEAFADEVARWLDSREPGARIGFGFIVVALRRARQHHARFDFRQRRGHQQVFRRQYHVHFFHQVEVGEVLLGDEGNGDIEDVDVLLADEVDEQIERAAEGIEQDAQGIGRDIEVLRQLGDGFAEEEDGLFHAAVLMRMSYGAAWTALSAAGSGAVFFGASHQCGWPSGGGTGSSSLLMCSSERLSAASAQSQRRWATARRVLAAMSRVMLPSLSAGRASMQAMSPLAPSSSRGCSSVASVQRTRAV